MPVFENLLSARETYLLAEIELLIGQVCRSNHVDFFACAESGDRRTLLLIAHEHVYWLSVTKRRQPAILEDLRIALGSPALLAGKFQRPSFIQEKQKMRTLLSLMAIGLIAIAVGCNKPEENTEATPATTPSTEAPETSAKVDAPAENPTDASKGEVQTVSLKVPNMT